MLLVLLLAMLPLSGCVIAVNTDDYEDGGNGWRAKQDRNARAIRHLSLGDRLDAIERDMGDADIVESFYRDGEEFKVLYYRTRRTHDDGKTTRDETTPLVFIDGELVGWGDSALEHATARDHQEAAMP